MYRSLIIICLIALSACSFHFPDANRQNKIKIADITGPSYSKCYIAANKHFSKYIVKNSALTLVIVDEDIEKTILNTNSNSRIRDVNINLRCKYKLTKNNKTLFENNIITNNILTQDDVNLLISDEDLSNTIEELSHNNVSRFFESFLSK